MARPRRTRTEQIEDLFVDLTATQQARCLEDLAKLQRWCLRIRRPATLDTADPARQQTMMPMPDISVHGMQQTDAETQRAEDWEKGSAEENGVEMETRCPPRT